MKPRVSIIAAIDDKRGLGKNNDLLFRISEDLKRFRKLTSGHPVIMGRKTFESLHMPNGLPNRTNIVLTRDHTYHVLKDDTAHSVFPYPNLTAGLEEAIRLARQKGLEEVFIIGGGQIFKEAIEKDLVDRLYVTVVKGDFGADTFFPDYSMFTNVVNKEDHEADGYQYTFLDLEK